MEQELRFGLDLGRMASHSDDYKILCQNSILKFRKLDDHRFLVKFLKDFDQNSGGQPLR